MSLFYFILFALVAHFFIKIENVVYLQSVVLAFWLEIGWIQIWDYVHKPSVLFGMNALTFLFKSQKTTLPDS